MYHVCIMNNTYFSQFLLQAYWKKHNKIKVRSCGMIVIIPLTKKGQICDPVHSHVTVLLQPSAMCETNTVQVSSTVLKWPWDDRL